MNELREMIQGMLDRYEEETNEYSRGGKDACDCILENMLNRENDELTKNTENREKALESLIAEMRETNRLLRLFLQSKGIII